MVFQGNLSGLGLRERPSDAKDYSWYAADCPNLPLSREATSLKIPIRLNRSQNRR